MVGSPSIFEPRQARTLSTGRLWSPVRIVWWTTATVAVLLIGLVMALSFYGVTHRDRIYQGVTVGGVDLSGLTRAEATQRLEAVGTRYGQAPLTFTADGDTVAVPPDEIGFDLDSAGSADRAFAFGRGGTLWSRTQDWAIAVLHGAPTGVVVQVDRGALDGWLAGLAVDLRVASVDARVDLVDGAPVLAPDQAGREVDVAASAVRVMGVLRRIEPGPVALVTTVTQPAVSAASLEETVPMAAAAVDAPFQLTAPEGSWGIAESDLSRIVSVDAERAELVVDRAAVANVVAGIADEVDRPAVDAGILVGDDGVLTVVPGQDSATVDVDATTDRAVEQIAAGADTIDVTMIRAEPRITDGMAAAGIAEANGYTEPGMTLTWSGGTLRLDRSDLLSALVISDTGGDPFLFQFDGDVLSGLVAPAFDRVDDPAVDARFRLVDGRVTQTQRSSDGRVVDRESTMSDLIRGIYEHRADVPLVVVDDRATITDEMGKAIKTPDTLAQGVTYYTGSSEPRRQNVERAAELETGWLIPPDGIFSYNELLGNVDAGNGFETGFGIVADEERGGVTTAPVMGGGICQVSTTIFQAAWWSGLDVVERYQHPYWLTGYGQAPLGRQGLDAMVNIEDTWSLDLKLRNTTGNWIAFVITADGDALTVSLMGTDPGWTVDVSEPVETARIPASEETEYIDSSEVPTGEELRVETAVDGFSVRVDRTVRDEDGNEILSDSVTSDYLPSRNLILRGTGNG